MTNPGFVVIHLYVGNLAPHKAEKFCDSVKKRITESEEWKGFKKSNPHWIITLLPSRTERSHVEIYHEIKEKRQHVEKLLLKIQQENKGESLQDSDLLRSQVKDYVLLMFGAPVVSVELADEQLDFIYEHCLSTIQDYHHRMKKLTIFSNYLTQNTEILQRGALAYGKVILARIRMKQNNPKDDKSYLEPEALYQEGLYELEKWRNLFNPKKKKY